MSQPNQEYRNDWNKRLAEELIQELPEMAEEIKMQLCVPHVEEDTAMVATNAPAPILTPPLHSPQVTAKPKSLLGELKEFRVKKRTYPETVTSSQTLPKQRKFDAPFAPRKSIIEVRLTSEPNRYFDETATTSDGVVGKQSTVMGGSESKTSTPNVLNSIMVKVGQVVENNTDIVLELAVEHLSRNAVQNEVLDLALHKNVERKEMLSRMPDRDIKVLNQHRMPDKVCPNTMEKSIPVSATFLNQNQDGLTNHCQYIDNEVKIAKNVEVHNQHKLMSVEICPTNAMAKNISVSASLLDTKKMTSTTDLPNFGQSIDNEMKRAKNMEVCNQNRMPDEMCPMDKYITVAGQKHISLKAEPVFFDQDTRTTQEKLALSKEAVPTNLSNDLMQPSEPLEIKIDSDTQNFNEPEASVRSTPLLVISTAERDLKTKGHLHGNAFGSISTTHSAANSLQRNSSTSDDRDNNRTTSPISPEKAEPTPIPQRNYGGGGAPATATVPIAAEVFMDYEDVNQAPEELTAEEAELDEKMRSAGTTFLQHLPCFKLPIESVADNIITKCRECRRRSSMAAQPPQDVYCRFIDFRRLQYSSEGVLSVSGFPNPYTEPTQEDINIWQPNDTTEPTAGYMDIQVCRYILLHAGDQFCYLWRQEAEALRLHENPNTRIAWKKVVRGTREICDVCDTTLFNFHWTCDKCGFGVCLDCFKDRKESRKCNKTRDEAALRMRDEFLWLFCLATPTQQTVHERNELMLTQIITGDSLNVLGRMLHEVRVLWQIPQLCGCLLSKQQLPDDFEMNDIIDDMIKGSELEQRTAASSLATKATFIEQERLEKIHDKKLKFARAHSIEYVAGRTQTKQSLDEDPITTAFDNFTHINFLRKGLAGLRKFLPPRAMSLAHSRVLGPGVPHEWLCDGKLLRLTNPIHPDNRLLFQDVWKCGQPVMISQVAKSLNLNLWRPDAFCKDFGDKPNDLINCLNGNLVPNQPMRNFWEGFECIKKRLLDANGKPMLLKLKDWPPGDDFAEILPTRYADLMNGLPLPEYTLRTGNLNIASCLPKMFVPPDLGPKMYNAYGSALHPDKGTTNLHLDISDAVNIMVYVGIPKDADETFQSSATQRAIAIGGCDYITRTRSQNRNVVPGALWHIFPARDADKIRDLLNRVTLENGFRLEPDHDPIHDQNWYLDDRLRARLFREYGVEAYPIVQCLGDAVFIPAGAPHQVQNLHNCIKVAEDFVSPENITHCYHLTHEFRRLSHSHTNHEDKLQIKNIIYHAIKDCCTILNRALKKRIMLEVEKKKRLIEEFKKKQAEEAAKKAEEALAAMEEEDDDEDEDSTIEESSSTDEDTTDTEGQREDSTDAGDEREDTTDSESAKQSHSNAKFRNKIVVLKNKLRANEAIHEDSEEETEEEGEIQPPFKRSLGEEDSDGDREVRVSIKRSTRDESVERKVIEKQRLPEENKIEERRNHVQTVNKISEGMTEDTDDAEQRNKEPFNHMQISSDMNEDTDEVAEKSEDQNNGSHTVEEINETADNTNEIGADCSKENVEEEYRVCLNTSEINELVEAEMAKRIEEDTEVDDRNETAERNEEEERNAPGVRNETEEHIDAGETNGEEVMTDSLVVEYVNEVANNAENVQEGLIADVQEENSVSINASEIKEKLVEAEQEIEPGECIDAERPNEASPNEEIIEDALNSLKVSECVENTEAIIDISANESNFVENQNDAIDAVTEINAEPFNYSKTNETVKTEDISNFANDFDVTEKDRNSEGLNQNVITKITNEDTDDADEGNESLLTCKHDEVLIEDKEDIIESNVQSFSTQTFEDVDIVEHMDYGKEIYKVQEDETISVDLNDSTENGMDEPSQVSVNINANVEEELDHSMHAENKNEEVNESFVASEEGNSEPFNYSQHSCDSNIEPLNCSKDANVADRNAVEHDEDMHENMSTSSEDAVKYVVKNILESGNVNQDRIKRPFTPSDTSNNEPTKYSDISTGTTSNEPLNYSKELDAGNSSRTSNESEANYNATNEDPLECTEIIEENLDESLVSQSTGDGLLNRSSESEDITIYDRPDAEILNRSTNSEYLSDDHLNCSGNSDGISDQPLNLSN